MQSFDQKNVFTGSLKDAMLSFGAYRHNKFYAVELLLYQTLCRVYCVCVFLELRSRGEKCPENVVKSKVDHACHRDRNNGNYSMRA